MNQICLNCDDEIESPIAHNCIRGITKNINDLHSKLDKLNVKKLDHLDGLKCALEIVEGLEYEYKSMGYDYSLKEKDPFYDIKNQIRMYLGLDLIIRR